MAESGILRRLLTETWPAKAARSALEALMLPGQVASGQLNVAPSVPGYWSDEDQGRLEATNASARSRATDLAGLLMGGGYGAAQPGAVGIFGGRLAKTADQAALSRAEGMAAKGESREKIWNETGWFQGSDGKWRFEIDDSKSAISPRVVAEFEKRGVGDQIPVQNADRFFDHPELFKAYDDLWRANTRLTKGGGYPYQPEGHYFVRESGAEGIGLNADTLGRARSMGMHELQHAIQRREGFSPGADYNALGKELYHQAPGEIEAYNVQRRLFMTPEQRKKLPPWKTE